MVNILLTPDGHDFMSARVRLFLVILIKIGVNGTPRMFLFK